MESLGETGIFRGGIGQAAVKLEVMGLFEELEAVHPASQFGARKFEAILAGLPGLIQRLLEVADAGGGVEGVEAGLGALLLELVELGFGEREGAIEALLVEAEACQEIGAGVEGVGL